MAHEKKTSQQKFTEFEESASYGAMYDKLNIRTISFWTIMGMAVLIIVVAGVITLFNYNKFQFQQAASFDSEFQDFSQRRANEQAHLNTYGVIDEEAGIYHIPIDSAIDLYITESEQ